MVTEEQLEILTNDYKWVQTSNKISIYISEDKLKLLISQLHGRTVNGILSDNMMYNVIIFTKDQFKKFIELNDDLVIGDVEIKFKDDSVYLKQGKESMNFKLSYFENSLKSEIVDDYNNDIKKFVNETLNIGYEDFLLNLGFDKKSDKKFELIKDNKQTIVIYDKKTELFDIHIKNQSFNGLDYDRLKNTINKIMNNTINKIFNENVILTFSQFVNENKEDENSEVNIRNRNIRYAALKQKAELEKAKQELKNKPKLTKLQKTKLEDELFYLRQDIKSKNDEILELKKDIKRTNSNMDLEAGQKGDSWNDDDANKYGIELEKLNSEIEELTNQIENYSNRIKEIEKKL